MVRQRSADFVPRLLQAAARVFARQGLKGSRMADIAREMGVAHGSLYNYVESKEALFLLLVDQWGRADLDLRDRELPLKTPPMDSIVSRLRQRVAKTFPLRALDAALSCRWPPHPETELRAVVQELFDQTERSREGATILDFNWSKVTRRVEPRHTVDDAQGAKPGQRNEDLPDSNKKRRPVESMS